jgi:hypothetical protein
MIRKTIFTISLILSISAQAQTLGGGTNFSNAVTFNQTWLTGCPSGGSTFSNQAAFEPTTTLDPCAPVPSCATGTTGSDVWFSFYAQTTTATIAVDPSASFDIAIQAFSGASCPVLTEIGCANVGGNNANETLNLTGLLSGVRYYFRIYGEGNAAQRTGTYTFCGSAQLGSTPLPVEMSSFSASEENGRVILKWTTESEWDNSYFEIERSKNAGQYTPIGKVTGSGTSSQKLYYSFTDLTPFSETNYYRLKQVDIDGSYKYSVILPVKLNTKLRKAVNISPNPVTDNINIRVSSDVVATNSDIKILSASGQVIHQQKGNFVKGENIIIINNMKSLSRGIYTLQAIVGGQMLSTKFISIR